MKTQITPVKEFTTAQFETIDRLILAHLQSKPYMFQPTHDPKSAGIFEPKGSEGMNNTLGLAYTSSSDYAAMWVCNAGYLWYNDTKYFIGFSFDINGDLCAIIEDENENTEIVSLNA